MNEQRSTSFFTRLLLKILYNRSYSEGFAGDIEEEYNERAETQGKSSANFWLVAHIIKSLPGSIINNIIWSFVMFKNYFKTAVRNILKNRVSSAINITGLALGIASCIIVILFVKDELTVDKFHVNYDNIYRLRMDLKIRTGDVRQYATIRGKVLDEFIVDMPEVITGTKISRHNGIVVSYKDKKFNESINFVSNSFLSIFSFPLIKGDKNTALVAPFKTVITEKLANKLFDKDEEPLGKTISVDSKYHYEITGIMKNSPVNSTLKVDFLASHPSLRTVVGEQWNNRNLEAYVLLRSDANVENLRKKIPEFTQAKFPKLVKNRTYLLQSMSEIYFSPWMALENSRKGEMKFSYTYSLIGFLILIIGCINFINLSTARAAKRAREVGIRKVVGARKTQLVKQFIGESLLMSVGAFFVALLLVELALPYFNEFAAKELSLSILSEPALFGGLFGLSALIGILSGLYPAFVLSSFHPVDVIKSATIKSDSGKLFQKSLVIFQFAVSIVFLIGITVIQSQMNFMRTKDLGFEKENILRAEIIRDRTIGERLDLLKSKLMKNPNVIDVFGYRSSPGMWGGSEMNFRAEGFDEEILLNSLIINPGYFKFFGIPILQGREFSSEIGSDTLRAAIINEAAAKELGWDNPIGKSLKATTYEDLDGVVVGVVKDFHSGNLYSEIKPTVFTYPYDYYTEVALKIIPGSEKEMQALLTKTISEFAPQLILWSSFLDEALGNAYYKEVETGKVYKFASFMSLFLACLGLFGLASFTVQNRIKEIGIRKVLGGSVMSLVNLISIDFLKLVAAANILAWPVAYYIMSQYLESFAYRIELGPWLFISAGLIALVISLVTIASQSIKAANKNPVDVLRCE